MPLSPTSWPGGGGSAYTPPTTRGVFDAASSATIANGATAFLEWHDGGYPGGPVVDLTDPTAPAVLASGIYAVSAEATGTGLTADGYFVLSLYLDANGDGIVVATHSRLATAASATVRTAITGSYYIPSGGTIRLRVANQDGAAARDFFIEAALVERLT